MADTPAVPRPDRAPGGPEETGSRIRVAVTGAGGRMGSAAVDAVRAAPDLELVAALRRDDDLEQIVRARADVLVDLTVPESTEEIVHFAVRHGIHAVVGTTGWDDSRLAALRDALTAADGVGVLIAPNFAVGSVLATAFAAKAARFFDSVEIIELHHPDKVDAPSGTAARTAALVADARRAAGTGPSPDATRTEAPGARGADVDGVRVHSVRLRGLVAHQEVLLGSPGETLTIRHDSLDRASFMPGVLLGVRSVPAAPGLTHGLDAFLGLDEAGR
ncbi:4-hydroxy-tetrahydrodipicolinate reductase [Tersicoccus solisilvae]|uniref:4-hydroxy-tetrahydrodipicolinate reductase n=1 Tax=Tersicoccus solisilvae TaxID=1882339 RepID=A0ABQ1PPZ2_9MICC|nr:4-hydroxy-tetrahydrodipicolinate reductase [Tersicoccus solisilvae]GGD00931.1 4-hydroxy-tetrahydrodipicolinate reductase [Tersicoccus solisilvae]